MQFELHYNTTNSYLLFNEKEIFTFKVDSENENFPTQFCLSNAYDFSVY